MSDRYGYAGFKFRHTSFIAELCRQLNCQNYLELGTYDGHNLSEISTICNVVGVDIKDEHRLSQRFGSKFFLGTTEQFFAQNRRSFDVIFIDADHNFQSVKKDFIASLKILNPMGLIILHDTDPSESKLMEPGYCGDSYKMVRYLEETWPDLDKICIPMTEAGLTIVKRRDENRFNYY
jgi:predicted O-methyltransferase YrrM